MKKITTLFTLLLLCAVTAMAQKQGTQVTSTASLKDGVRYVFRIGTTGSYITESGTQYVAPNTANTITDNALFTLKANGSSWKVLNETTGNYWSALANTTTTGFSPVAEASAGSWAFNFNSGNVTAQENGNYYINRSSGVIHGWATAISGLLMYHVGVTSLDQLSNDKVYNICSPRGDGAWAVGAGATEANSVNKLGLTLSDTDVKQQFAFITYEGNVYLYSVSESKFAYVDGTKLSLSATVTPAVANSKITFTASSSGSQKATYPTIITVDGKYFGIHPSATPNVYNYQYQNDDGNAARVEEVGTFDSSAAIAALEEYYNSEPAFNDAITKLESYPYGTGLNQYSLVVESQDYTSQAATIIAGLKEQGYSTENLAVANALLAGTSLNLPQAGMFLRIKSAHDTYLSGVASTASANRLSFTTTADASTIFYFNGNKLLTYGNGIYANGRDVAALGGAGLDNYRFEESTISAGKYAIRFHPGQGEERYLYAHDTSKNYADQNGADHAYCAFTLTEITELPITLRSTDNENYFATFSAPVNVQITGAALNRVEKKTKTASYEAVDTDMLPAGTGVLLTGTDASATATIITTDVAAADYGLKSYYAATAGTGATDKLYLGKGKNSGKAGFYKLGEGTTSNGFKAYLLDESGNGAKEGFELVFGGEVTGVETIDNGQLTIDNSPVYNLQGQRVNKAQKGVYIINNKKVVVK